MKSLYVRIAVTYIVIALASCTAALLLSNFYYLDKLRQYNERKIMNIATEIRALHERSDSIELSDYLTYIGNLGFQLYAVNDRMEGTFYGTPFRDKEIGEMQIRSVLNGQPYRGILEEKHLLMVTGFFENSIRNSAGIPLDAGARRYALFVRPNLEQQFGEVRILLAVLLGVTFVLSIMLIAICSRFIVKPVKELIRATNEIVKGNYTIRMDVARRDEIGNLARDFTYMAQTLERLDSMRQEFVANVSHEIQSPLTSIQGFAQSILDNEPTPEESRRSLQIIADESARLSTLSKQLLTLAALDKETSAVKRSAFRLDEQLRQVLIVTELQWSDKQLTIEPDLPEVLISADPQLLYQVWLNLLANSIKFTPRGGTIRVEITVQHDTVVVTVSDTGVGIPEAELTHIFERFYKADKARNRTRPGSGLGLAIADKIVALHGGTIEAHSALGEGTTVEVRLPQIHL